MTDPDYLVSNKALSLSDQPNLRALYEVMADPGQRITLFIGAGVSMDSGFPSWNSLVDSLVEGLSESNDTLPELIALDQDDIIRKTETITQISTALSGIDSSTAQVRKALYKGKTTTEPGPLMRHIAQLVKVLSGRVTILTTNFDDVIDTALRQLGIMHKVLPVTKALTSNNKWNERYETQPKSVPIVHLHGRLPRRSAVDVESIVFSESQFLRNARVVQEVIGEALADSAVLFLGVSMNDPNVVTPLWSLKSRGRKPPTFISIVPTPLGEGLADERLRLGRSYSIHKALHIEKNLGVRPIFLKSYAQQMQMIEECRLASQSGEEHLKPTEHYGAQFSALIDSILTRLNVPTDPRKPYNDQALYLRLLEAAGDSGSISQVARRIAGKATTREKLKKLGVSLGVPSIEVEEFGLHLWVRNAADDDVEPYSVRMIASSHQSLSPGISRPLQEVPVNPASRYLAARVLATGKAYLHNLTHEERAAKWSASYAVPVRLPVTRSGCDSTMLVGAICLVSTSSYVSPRGVKNIDPLYPLDSVSFLSVLTHQEKNDLMQELERLASAILSGK